MNTMLTKFGTCKRGNFGMMLAVLSVPVVASVGMMIEYTNLSNNKSRLQHAVDAAALFVGKYNIENGKLPSDSDILAFVEKNFDGSVEGAKVLGKGTKNADFTLQVTSRAPDYFFGSVVPDVFNQVVEAGVPKSDEVNVDIAMVLDTTFSMSADGKLDALKSTAKQFIDDLKPYSKTPGDIKVGLVPFDTHVNVGLANRNATWMSVAADSSRTENQCRTTYTGGTQQCTTETVIWDGVETTRQQCTNVGGTPTTTCENVTVSETWRGCVGSRHAPYTFRDTAPNAQFTGLMNVWCANAITPLSYDWDALKSEIDTLVARRDTYAAVGVMWGLRVLSPQEPFTEASTSSSPQKVMILMADGDNTRSHNLANNGYGNWSRDGVAGDTNTKLACDAAKSDGTIIYSIAFGDSISTRGQDVLQDCAGTTGGYFRAKNASELKKAFDGILQRVVRLRLTG